MKDLTRSTVIEAIARRDRLYRFVSQCHVRGIVPTSEQVMAAMADDRSVPLVDELLGAELTISGQVLTARGINGVSYNPSDVVNHELLVREPDFVERLHRQNQADHQADRYDSLSSRLRGSKAAPPGEPCQGCVNYYGKTDGGNKLVCAIHPSGVEGDICLDKAEG